MKKKESSGKKSLIIIICVIASLVLFWNVIFPWWFISSVEKADEATDELIGKPIAITNIEEIEKYAEHINIFKSSEILESTLSLLQPNFYSVFFKDIIYQAIWSLRKTIIMN